jgi:hypothetical protein
MKEARLQNPVLMDKDRIPRRVFAPDEMAQPVQPGRDHTEVQELPHKRLRRCGSDRGKVNVIARGGPTNYEMVMVRSQQGPY